MGKPKSKPLRREPKPVVAPEVEVDEPSERLLDETEDYIIIVETYSSQRSMTGTDQGYGILNKHTGVVEMRWACYAEALQGLILLQDQMDKWMTAYKKRMGMLN